MPPVRSKICRWPGLAVVRYRRVAPLLKYSSSGTPAFCSAKSCTCAVSKSFVVGFHVAVHTVPPYILAT
ncbi:hypothetical protein D3C81_1732340 [compost metagenome]